ncbi:YHS domain-containing (seleno)protein [Psychroserpens algicola]|uniref:YHS domain-containing (seleno)protein n=1 Tax=Psychroserpens algicola TaxID=1719034 RepID=UPI001952EA82|nr:YHS domain-containing (seleno)protein [Psychroserpens algicola]
MKLSFLNLLLVFGILNTSAQTIDYNTKAGYVAKGYDVVAYFNNEAIKGRDTFQTTYDDVKFKFSSEANLNTFKNNPQRYIPQYGGYCAYAVAVDSKKIDINPKTFEIRDGKLYLFYNSWFNNTLTSWKKNNVKGLQEKADQHWEVIKIE